MVEVDKLRDYEEELIGFKTVSLVSLVSLAEEKLKG